VSAGIGHDTSEPRSRLDRRERWFSRWKFLLIGLLGAYVLLGGYNLISVLTSGQLFSVFTSGAAAKPTSPARHAAAPAPVAPPATKITASTPAVSPLTVASVAAFGPAGAVNGDNPGIVSRINDGGAQPWYSSWYTTPEFGNLKSGTGLLLDMGNAVTVSSVRLALGSQAGADVQVRVGNDATMSGLTPVASASDVGQAVRLPVASPSSGRYVLIWFTRLPPNGQGDYQIDVYGVTVDGTTG
jgi:hypothetical protein